MQKLVGWLIVGVSGFGLMLFSYFGYQHDGGGNPWADAFMYVGRGEPNSLGADLEYIATSVRLLPASKTARAFGAVARTYGATAEKAFLLQFQESVLLSDEIAEGLTSEMLEWGRFPSPGANEVIGGCQRRNQNTVVVAGKKFKVVGGLKREVRLFANSYLLFGDLSGEVFGEEDGIENAYILQLSAEESGASEMRERLREAFPRQVFALYIPMIWTDTGPYYLYMAGMALMLLGGSMVLFGAYIAFGGRIKNKWLGQPLWAIDKYKQLFLGIHALYFGMVLLFALLVHHLPELQMSLWVGVKSSLAAESSPLGIAAKAYLSKSIVRAAVATFAVNFPLGSLACITIPSIILPGTGAFIACLRSMLWGILLAPNSVRIAGMMLPHSITLLLEGEGYILATFFGLLVPIYLFRRSEGASVAGRYGKAVLLNVRGNLVVAIVLAVAAIYEAVEVILALR